MIKSEVREGVVYLSGEISVKTITSTLMTQITQDCHSPDVCVVDCSGVEKADSACLSLLLQIQRTTKKAMQWRAIPQSVQALAELYEIQDRIQA